MGAAELRELMTKTMNADVTVYVYEEFKHTTALPHWSYNPVYVGR
jgi:hypothetical protein